MRKEDKDNSFNSIRNQVRWVINQHERPSQAHSNSNLDIYGAFIHANPPDPSRDMAPS